MQLTHLINRELVVKKTVKGYCRGVALSLKSHAVKYLLCSTEPFAECDFAISTASVCKMGDQITVNSLRPLLPKSCAKIFIGRPVYSSEGVYLGKITDLTLCDFIATHLSTDQGEVYPVSAIEASQDALLLKREQPFPIGSRIPAPLLSRFTDKKDGLVTKPVLRSAIKNESLLRLTLALAPFEIEF